MLRTLRKNNAVLQIGTLRDRRVMGASTVSFRDYDAAVSCLRRFTGDPYNMTVLRGILRESSCHGTVPACSDQEVVAQVARKVARGELLIARQRAVPCGGGSSTPAVKEVTEPEPKKWNKTEYIKQFLREHELEPVRPKPAQESNWVAFRVLYDDTDEPVAGVDLKIKLPDGSTNIYTTDGAGKIYISGLPEGTCDVQEMLDNDALEVVKVLAG